MALGLDRNIEGALSYLLFWISGLIFLLLEKEDDFVRFHAMQSFITFLSLSIINIIISKIPIIGWIISALINIAIIILWIVGMFKAYNGEKYKFPIFGDIAEKYYREFLR
ncbi:conserved membrane protein of unknown function [Methanocaldococcus lauensis]|uniref:Uncharacterized protein n=1 Tax=Methanocaldococcus lauensis TaxID=2546128 RepID=A0A8D6PVR6_9EURY|nr:DUF4870 domain-containing protein [Methanocaldococcus lauensis]CAB3289011.1 conserved membrane protein of unknown function [Methanocaldococcus lauensis]CAB3289654.1 conserved membrane protein of unknown function [Methanocaldococcus lauensis]